jgi:hypothetical protein
MTLPLTITAIDVLGIIIGWSIITGVAFIGGVMAVKYGFHSDDLFSGPSTSEGDSNEF